MPELPPGIEPTELDAALLVAALRDVYRATQRAERTSASPEVRTVCQQLRELIEQQIDGVAHRRAAWDALKTDLTAALVEALRGEPPIPPRDNDHLPVI